MARYRSEHLDALDGYDQISKWNATQIRQLQRHRGTFFADWEQSLQNRRRNGTRIFAIMLQDGWCR